jgi:5'-3' exonuclease
MSNQNLVEQLEQYKNEYYSENTKNRIFKSKQKIDCAVKIAAQVSMDDLLSKSMYIIPNTKKVFIDYSIFKLYAHPGIYDKIINYIRYYGNKEETYCINGMDADLIMLALGTHMPKFYILREDMYEFDIDFLCVDIGAIRSELADKLRWKKDGFAEKSAINDFIFLCFMVGNDFLPHIPSIEIIQKGIELILDVYKETGQIYGHITREINDRVEFLPIPLQHFLTKIGNYEKENLECKLQKKNFFPDPLLENCATENSYGKWDVDIEKYKHQVQSDQK